MNDPLFQEYVGNLKVLSSFTLYEYVDLEKMQSDFSSIHSKDDFKIKVKQYFKKPDEFINRAYETHEITLKFWAKNDKFHKLDNLQKEKIIKSSVLKLLKPDDNSINSTEGTMGQCEDQRDSTKQTCTDAALVAAAGCGLLTPTLIGALGCGVVVIAGDAVCQNGADDSYDICKSYE